MAEQNQPASPHELPSQRVEQIKASVQRALSPDFSKTPGDLKLIQESQLDANAAREQLTIIQPNTDQELYIPQLLSDNLFQFMNSDQQEVFVQEGILQRDAKNNLSFTDKATAEERLKIVGDIMEDIQKNGIESANRPDVLKNVGVNNLNPDTAILALQVLAIDLGEEALKPIPAEDEPETALTTVGKKRVIEKKISGHMQMPERFRTRNHKEHGYTVEDHQISNHRADIYQVRRDQAIKIKGEDVTFETLEQELVKGGFANYTQLVEQFSDVQKLFNENPQLSQTLERDAKGQEYLQNNAYTRMQKALRVALTNPDIDPEVAMGLQSLIPKLDQRTVSSAANLQEAFKEGMSTLFNFRKLQGDLSSSDPAIRQNSLKKLHNDFYRWGEIMYGHEGFQRPVEFDLKMGVAMQDLLLPAEARAERIRLEQKISTLKKNIADSTPREQLAAMVSTNTEYQDALRELENLRQEQRKAILSAFNVQTFDGQAVIDPSSLSADTQHLAEQVEQQFSSHAHQQMMDLNVNQTVDLLRSFRLVAENPDSKVLDQIKKEVQKYISESAITDTTGKTKIDNIDNFLTNTLKVDPSDADYANLRTIFLEARRISKALGSLKNKPSDSFSNLQNIKLGGMHFSMGLKGIDYLYRHGDFSETTQDVTASAAKKEPAAAVATATTTEPSVLPQTVHQYSIHQGGHIVAPGDIGQQPPLPDAPPQESAPTSPEPEQPAEEPGNKKPQLIEGLDITDQQDQINETQAKLMEKIEDELRQIRKETMEKLAEHGDNEEPFGGDERFDADAPERQILDDTALAGKQAADADIKEPAQPPAAEPGDQTQPPDGSTDEEQPLIYDDVERALRELEGRPLPEPAPTPQTLQEKFDSLEEQTDDAKNFEDIRALSYTEDDKSGYLVEQITNLPPSTIDQYVQAQARLRVNGESLTPEEETKFNTMVESIVQRLEKNKPDWDKNHEANLETAEHAILAEIKKQTEKLKQNPPSEQPTQPHYLAIDSLVNYYSTNQNVNIYQENHTVSRSSTRGKINGISAEKNERMIVGSNQGNAKLNGYASAHVENHIPGSGSKLYLMGNSTAFVNYGDLKSIERGRNPKNTVVFSTDKTIKKSFGEDTSQIPDNTFILPVDNLASLHLHNPKKLLEKNVTVQKLNGKDVFIMQCRDAKTGNTTGVAIFENANENLVYIDGGLQTDLDNILKRAQEKIGAQSDQTTPQTAGATASAPVTPPPTEQLAPEQPPAPPEEPIRIPEASLAELQEALFGKQLTSKDLIDRSGHLGDLTHPEQQQLMDLLNNLVTDLQPAAIPPAAPPATTSGEAATVSPPAPTAEAEANILPPETNLRSERIQELARITREQGSGSLYGVISVVDPNDKGRHDNSFSRGRAFIRGQEVTSTKREEFDKILESNKDIRLKFKIEKDKPYVTIRKGGNRVIDENASSFGAIGTSVDDLIITYVHPIPASLTENRAGYYVSNTVVLPPEIAEQVIAAAEQDPQFMRDYMLKLHTLDGNNLPQENGFLIVDRRENEQQPKITQVSAQSIPTPPTAPSPSAQPLVTTSTSTVLPPAQPTEVEAPAATAEAPAAVAAPEQPLTIENYTPRAENLKHNSEWSSISPGMVFAEAGEENRFIKRNRGAVIASNTELSEVATVYPTGAYIEIESNQAQRYTGTTQNRFEIRNHSRGYIVDNDGTVIITQTGAGHIDMNVSSHETEIEGSGTLFIAHGSTYVKSISEDGLLFITQENLPPDAKTKDRIMVLGLTDLPEIDLSKPDQLKQQHTVAISHNLIAVGGIERTTGEKGIAIFEKTSRGWRLVDGRRLKDIDSSNEGRMSLRQRLKGKINLDLDLSAIAEQATADLKLHTPEPAPAQPAQAAEAGLDLTPDPETPQKIELPQTINAGEVYKLNSFQEEYVIATNNGLLEIDNRNTVEMQHNLARAKNTGIQVQYQGRVIITSDNRGNLHLQAQGSAHVDYAKSIDNNTFSMDGLSSAFVRRGDIHTIKRTGSLTSLFSIENSIQESFKDKPINPNTFIVPLAPHNIDINNLPPTIKSYSVGDKQYVAIQCIDAANSTNKGIAVFENRNDQWIFVDGRPSSEANILNRRLKEKVGITEDLDFSFPEEVVAEAPTSEPILDPQRTAKQEQAAHLQDLVDRLGDEVDKSRELLETVQDGVVSPRNRRLGQEIAADLDNAQRAREVVEGLRETLQDLQPAEAPTAEAAPEQAPEVAEAAADLPPPESEIPLNENTYLQMRNLKPYYTFETEGISDTTIYPDTPLHSVHHREKNTGAFYVQNQRTAIIEENTVIGFSPAAVGLQEAHIIVLENKGNVFLMDQSSAHLDINQESKHTINLSGDSTAFVHRGTLNGVGWRDNALLFTTPPIVETGLSAHDKAMGSDLGPNAFVTTVNDLSEIDLNNADQLKEQNITIINQGEKQYTAMICTDASDPTQKAVALFENANGNLVFVDGSKTVQGLQERVNKKTGTEIDLSSIPEITVAQTQEATADTHAPQPEAPTEKRDIFAPPVEVTGERPVFKTYAEIQQYVLAHYPELDTFIQTHQNEVLPDKNAILESGLKIGEHTLSLVQKSISKGDTAEVFFFEDESGKKYAVKIPNKINNITTQDIVMDVAIPLALRNTPAAQNTAQTTLAFAANGYPCVVMEYVDWETTNMVHQKALQRLTTDDIATSLKQAVTLMDELHKLNLSMSGDMKGADFHWDREHQRFIRLDWNRVSAIGDTSRVGERLNLASTGIDIRGFGQQFTNLIGFKGAYEPRELDDPEWGETPDGLKKILIKMHSGKYDSAQEVMTDMGRYEQGQEIDLGFSPKEILQRKYVQEEDYYNPFNRIINKMRQMDPTAAQELLNSAPEESSINSQERRMLQDTLDILHTLESTAGTAFLFSPVSEFMDSSLGYLREIRKLVDNIHAGADQQDIEKLANLEFSLRERINKTYERLIENVSSKADEQVVKTIGLPEKLQTLKENLLKVAEEIETKQKNKGVIPEEPAPASVAASPSRSEAPTPAPGPDILGDAGVDIQPPVAQADEEIVAPEEAPTTRKKTDEEIRYDQAVQSIKNYLKSQEEAAKQEGSKDAEYKNIRDSLPDLARRNEEPLGQNEVAENGIYTPPSGQNAYVEVLVNHGTIRPADARFIVVGRNDATGVREFTIENKKSQEDRKLYIANNTRGYIGQNQGNVELSGTSSLHVNSQEGDTKFGITMEGTSSAFINQGPLDVIDRSTQKNSLFTTRPNLDKTNSIIRVLENTFILPVEDLSEIDLTNQQLLNKHRINVITNGDRKFITMTCIDNKDKQKRGIALFEQAKGKDGKDQWIFVDGMPQDDIKALEDRVTQKTGVKNMILAPASTARAAQTQEAAAVMWAQYPDLTTNFLLHDGEKQFNSIKRNGRLALKDKAHIAIHTNEGQINLDYQARLRLQKNLSIIGMSNNSHTRIENDFGTLHLFDEASLHVSNKQDHYLVFNGSNKVSAFIGEGNINVTSAEIGVGSNPLIFVPANGVILNQNPNESAPGIVPVAKLNGVENYAVLTQYNPFVEHSPETTVPGKIMHQDTITRFGKQLERKIIAISATIEPQTTGGPIKQAAAFFEYTQDTEGNIEVTFIDGRPENEVKDLMNRFTIKTGIDYLSTVKEATMRAYAAEAQQRTHAPEVVHENEGSKEFIEELHRSGFSIFLDDAQKLQVEQNFGTIMGTGMSETWADTNNKTIQNSSDSYSRIEKNLGEVVIRENGMVHITNATTRSNLTFKIEDSKETNHGAAFIGIGKDIECSFEGRGKFSTLKNGPLVFVPESGVSFAGKTKGVDVATLNGVKDFETLASYNPFAEQANRLGKQIYEDEIIRFGRKYRRKLIQMEATIPGNLLNKKATAVFEYTIDDQGSVKVSFFAGTYDNTKDEPEMRRRITQRVSLQKGHTDRAEKRLASQPPEQPTPPEDDLLAGATPIEPLF